MPWVSDPYPSSGRPVLNTFGKRGIPSLFLMNEDGTIAETEAGNILMNKKKTVKEIL